ncbi:hypothetical protein FB567DRAFT_595443 [Paraphoma chrysanthemicola]|uniref:Uncharacterized protein n=1 Tax=Paraphoma chrysanthemicola TaxID=798071 RepID=A0A8K0R1C0_9PLEO|nr:hypothetical protein FB567DRAFT_595443 [Paraphoma chrysanthemicola]
MRPTGPPSASYGCEPGTSTVPALVSPAYDTNTKPNKFSGPTKEDTAISDEDLLDARIPQEAAFATKFMANTNVVGQQSLDSQTDPLYGLMHVIEQINQRLPELNITGKDRFHQLINNIYAQCEEVKDFNPVASSTSLDPDVILNQDRHKSGDMVRLKRNMVKKIDTGTLVKKREEEQDKSASVGLRCERVGPAHEILADVSLASECHNVDPQEEHDQLLYQTFSATAMPSQGVQFHSFSEGKPPEEVDWIEKVVHGSSPKLNTLEQVRLQMQHRNGHGNDVGQYPTMVRAVSLRPDYDNDEAVGSGDDQACQFCSNWGCDYCKPDWFDSLLQEQGGPHDTCEGSGIFESSSEHHQNVHTGGALRVMHPTHRSSACTGAATDQHKHSATLGPAATDNVISERLDIGNAFSPALNELEHLSSCLSAVSSEVEKSVPEYPPRFATPDILREFDSNSLGNSIEFWGNGTGVHAGSGSVSGGGCWDTRWCNRDVPSTFPTMHEHLPSVTDFNDAGKFEKDNAVPADNAPVASKPYTVTYWATVECGDHITHIPMDSNNVTGFEKMILNGPAKKVWKWVQDKGLVDSISLQDAYDLAKDMQKPGIELHAKDFEGGHDDKREESRADFSVTVDSGLTTPSSPRT